MDQKRQTLQQQHCGPDPSAQTEPAGGSGGRLARGRAAVVLAFRETRAAWPGLSIYERFEQLVSLVLTTLVSVVVMAALVNLTFRVSILLVYGLLDPADHGIFQTIFGMIFTVLIAPEFNHSILGVLRRHESIIQVEAVVLIALLALARKFIIIDMTTVQPLTLIGLAGASLALGTVYWFVRDQDRKDDMAETRAGDPAKLHSSG
jgi:uncharacterized membrane protein (DUF373 family)